MLNSTRKYKLVYLDRENILTFEFDIDDLMHDISHGSELIYSLQEQTDEIIDLKIWEHNSFIVHRDKEDVGLIVRIQ